MPRPSLVNPNVRVDRNANASWLLLRYFVIACLALAAVRLACAHQPSTEVSTKPFERPLTGPVNLAVNGFNYTDLPIDHFSVGGAGGDIVVSSPTSGGGKTSCCVTWYPGNTLPRPIKVEWMRYVDGRQRWCEKTAQFEGPVPDRPTALGVHFMPDGEIKLMLTQGESHPLLRLPRFSAAQRKEAGNSIPDEDSARCRDGR